MRRWIIYTILWLVILSGCEQIYTPDIEVRNNVVVADARIVVGQENQIHLYKSKSFNDNNDDYLGITDAVVSLIDNDGESYNTQGNNNGYYNIGFDLDTAKQYKLHIEYLGNTYESSFEPVLKIPHLDSIYGIPEVKILAEAGENNVNNFKEKQGVQLYGDITYEKDMPYYRFGGRKILQYNYSVSTYVMGDLVPDVMYGWYTIYPSGAYNIAAPPEYSNTTDIIKHPLFFLERSKTLNSKDNFAGWILIMYQYGISKTAYQYYNDLNSQLEANGKLFDPMYVQAQSNIKCVNNKDQLVLGIFEISRIKEYRFFIKYASDGYLLKPIPHFYDIPFSGEKFKELPDFWEYEYKIYPDEP